MKHRPLPTDVVERFGHLPDVVYRGNDEWSSACPQCGGGRGGRDPSDRFRMWERQGQASNFWCRRCGYAGFTDDNQNGTPPSPERIRELDELRQREAAKEEARLRAKIDELRRQAYWEGYHDAMGEQQRELWRRQGIPDSLQDWFKLGYKAEHQYSTNGHLATSPAMTIPVFDVGWQAVNVQYRLLKPEKGAGKYRFTAGLPAPLYLTDPDNEPSGKALLVEGAKKAIVTFAHLGHKYTVVAVPSKMPGGNLIDRLDRCDVVYIALDPDAYGGKQSAAARLGLMLGNRARYVRLPAKPDDLLNDYGFTPDMLQGYINRATKVC